MTEEVLNTETEVFSADPGLREMIDAGVFYGRTKTKTNPKMRSFILSNRNGVEIINIEKTSELLDSALNFLKERVKAGGTFLFVGTQPSAVETVKTVAEELNFPAVITRWLGGTLTNFRVISKRIEYYKRLKADWQNESYRNKYTKKERTMTEKELEKLDGEMSSIANLTTRPDALIVVDPNLHMAAIKEANKLRIPIIALINTDVNPDLIDYPIPGNNKARTSVNWFVEKIAGAIREARLQMPKTETKENTNEGGNPKA